MSYKASVKFMAEALNRSRKNAGAGYSDLVCVATALLDTYDPEEYLDEAAMRARVEDVLNKLYCKGQMRIIRRER